MRADAAIVKLTATTKERPAIAVCEKLGAREDVMHFAMTVRTAPRAP